MDSAKLLSLCGLFEKIATPKYYKDPPGNINEFYF
jgi:hypothetical protein